ncbi:MAG: hypothetical protein R3206_09700 [Salegentibacter mishustinae]|nr:hypothetical protein [Salegentibacter mishustinae]
MRRERDDLTAGAVAGQEAGRVARLREADDLAQDMIKEIKKIVG